MSNNNPQYPGLQVEYLEVEIFAALNVIILI